MKYILYPVYALGVFLYTLYEILSMSLVYMSKLIWNFKRPQDGFNWKSWHLECDGYDPGNSKMCRCDLTIKDTLHRRLTNGDYKNITRDFERSY